MPLPAELPEDYDVFISKKNGENRSLLLTQRYSIIKKIGAGNFGTAFLVSDKTATLPETQQYV